MNPNHRRIYLDHAATSFPKPPGVSDAMTRFAREVGVSPGRGSYREVIESDRIVRRCREQINHLFNGQSADHVIFTLNCSDALNVAIKGVLRPGRANHVITTDLSHNSVLRPLNELERRGVATQTRIGCDSQSGLADIDAITCALRPETRLVVINHGSNVTGTVQPLHAIGAACREHGALLLVDAAQTAGHVPIDVQAMGIDLLAFPGHKGLLGPLGTGGLYIRPGIESLMDTCREGGTGSVSEDETQPEFMPDKFEPGSHNIIGISGLSEGVAYIADEGVENLWRRERQLIARLLTRFADDASYPGLTLYGPRTVENRCGVFSIGIDGYRPHELAMKLESDFGLLTRAGLHCAPRAHKTIGTFEYGGTVRLSFGPFLTHDDVEYVADCLAEVCCALAGLKTSLAIERVGA